MLIAFWTYGDLLSFWRSDETAVSEVGGYDCIGSGSYLAKYLADPIYTVTMKREETVALSVEILRETKEYVPGCGKKSHFLILNRDGLFGYVPGWDVSSQERYGKEFTSGF